MSPAARNTQKISSSGTGKPEEETPAEEPRIGHTVERADSPQLRGMVHAVRHLVGVEEK